MINKIFRLLVFSILILFIFTGTVYADASRHTSTVIVSNLNVEADGKDKVLVTIYLRDKSYNPEEDTVFIATNRGEVDKIWLKIGNEWIPVSSLSESNGDNVFYINNNIVKAKVDEKIELGISSNIKGNIKIAVGLKGEREVWQYLQGHLSESEAEIIPLKYKEEKEVIDNTKYYDLSLAEENQFITYTENKLSFEIRNKSGEKVIVEEDVKDIELKAKVITKPENADIKLTLPGDYEEQLQEKGLCFVNLYTDKPGEYELEVTLEIDYKNSFSSNTILKKNFSTYIKPKRFGAEKILLYLNQDNAVIDNKHQQMSLAPFIKDGRTFVPVRFIAEALEAEVTWLPETQTVILDRPDRKITMTIGNNAVLLENGKVILSDVAPFIKDGFTVLPFRIVAEVFGAQVSAGYDNSGNVESVIFYNQ